MTNLLLKELIRGSDFRKKSAWTFWFMANLNETTWSNISDSILKDTSSPKGLGSIVWNSLRQAADYLGRRFKKRTDYRSLVGLCAKADEKIVKGMLTGPVTILNWSFPREDISIKESTLQLALAIREEVLDLEKTVFASFRSMKLLCVKSFR